MPLKLWHSLQLFEAMCVITPYYNTAQLLYCMHIRAPVTAYMYVYLKYIHMGESEQTWGGNLSSLIFILHMYICTNCCIRGDCIPTVFQITVITMYSNFPTQHTQLIISL